MPGTARKSATTERAISDESVVNATGLGWDAWFAMLDDAGARTLSHPEIVAIVSERGKVGSWWRQMVTVEYERARGLRVKHETPRGYSVTASKTMAAPIERVFAAWKSATTRKRWLSDDGLEITTSTVNKSIRFKWKGKSGGAVGFIAKDENKTQIAIGHEKLGSAAAAERMKTFWKAQLVSLQAVVER